MRLYNVEWAESIELNFMYNGEVNIGHEHLPEFLKTAHLLQIRGLADGYNHSTLCQDGGTINHENTNNKIEDTATAEQKNIHNISLFTSNRQLTDAVTTNFSQYNKSSSKDINNIELKPFAALLVKKTNSNKQNNQQWEMPDAECNRNRHLTPPPQKRIKSADLFRAQHGISPERLLIDSDIGSQRHTELKDSLLGQALESPQIAGNQKQLSETPSLNLQSAEEESNSDDSDHSDHGDGQAENTLDSLNDTLGNQRSQSFHSAFLGLPGLISGPSGINANDYVSTRRSLEMRVRATDPRPCPKCGKIYRSAHTLRTHLEDKHTICPGYRCVLCGTVAKSRNSLHSHMSRQHRGISTKDLPVLPMPSPFDPELASRLLAKAGVKISPAELRARASPTSVANNGNQPKINLPNMGNDEEIDDSDEDPEDLTTASGCPRSQTDNDICNDLTRLQEKFMSNIGQSHTQIDKASTTSSQMVHQKHFMESAQSSTSGQSLFDTYLQFITESTFGMGLSQEHAAAAALHAAKIARINAIGQNLESPSSEQSRIESSKLSLTGNMHTVEAITNASTDLHQEKKLGSASSLNETVKTHQEHNDFVINIPLQGEGKLEKISPTRHKKEYSDSEVGLSQSMDEEATQNI